MDGSSLKKRRSVCLFGSSADPPTGSGGHVGIVKALSKQLGATAAASSCDGGFDEIRVLPVYRHTYQDKRHRLVSFEHRLQMSRMAFASIPGVVVSDAEYQSWLHASRGLSDSERVHVNVGTAALLDYLHATEPQVDFSFCLGADAFLDLTAGKWKESERVLELLEGRLIVLHRKSAANAGEGHSSNHDSSASSSQQQILQQRIAETPGARLLHIDQLGSVSSSQVRACESETELATLVVPGVLAYIKENKLYQFSETNIKE